MSIEASLPSEKDEDDGDDSKADFEAVDESDDTDGGGDNDEDEEVVLSAGEVVRFVIVLGDWRETGKEADDDDDDSAVDCSSESIELERESRLMIAPALAAACFVQL